MKRPIKIPLRWELSSNGKDCYLFAGTLLVELVWLEKRQKLRSAAIWLPGIYPGKEFNTLEAHQRNIEAKVEHFFRNALAREPAKLEVLK